MSIDPQPMDPERHCDPPSLRVRAATLTFDASREAWLGFCAALAAAQEPLPARTTQEPLGAWLARPLDSDPSGTNRVAWAVLRAGIAPADLLTFAVILDADYSPPEGPDWAAKDLVWFLRNIVVDYPDMTVRDAVAWTLLNTQEQTGATVEPNQRSWVAAGLGGPRGWLAAAAGISPQEAAAGFGDGSLTEAAARSLAALRGVLLPV